VRAQPDPQLLEKILGIRRVTAARREEIEEFGAVTLKDRRQAICT
jgi:hypothetical protein